MLIHVNVPNRKDTLFTSNAVHSYRIELLASRLYMCNKSSYFSAENNNGFSLKTGDLEEIVVEQSDGKVESVIEISTKGSMQTLGLKQIPFPAHKTTYPIERAYQQAEFLHANLRKSDGSGKYHEAIMKALKVISQRKEAFFTLHNVQPVAQSISASSLNYRWKYGPWEQTNKGVDFMYTAHMYRRSMSPLLATMHVTPSDVFYHVQSTLSMEGRKIVEISEICKRTNFALSDCLIATRDVLQIKGESIFGY